MQGNRPGEEDQPWRHLAPDGGPSSKVGKEGTCQRLAQDATVARASALLPLHLCALVVRLVRVCLCRSL